MQNASGRIRREARHGGLSRLAALGPSYGALAALLLLVLFNAIFTPNFATASNLWNILLQVSPTVLVALGMTLVIATGGIDLSVGSVMAIASALAATLLDRGAAVAAARRWPPRWRRAVSMAR
jgi:ribose/xylose/arabinose/galactoside ABC-type transport system permease subunit